MPPRPWPNTSPGRSRHSADRHPPCQPVAQHATADAANPILAQRVHGLPAQGTSTPRSAAFSLLIDVEYTCTSGTCHYNPADWTVRAKDGRTYDDADYESGYSDQELDFGDLVKGAKARGLIVVDAPKGAMTLEYTSGYGAPATWTIPTAQAQGPALRFGASCVSGRR